jgi:hypothetical protein
MQSRWKTWPQAPQAMDSPSSEACVGLAWYSMDGSCSELRQMAHVSVQMLQLHTATAFHFFTCGEPRRVSAAARRHQAPAPRAPCLEALLARRAGAAGLRAGASVHGHGRRLDVRHGGRAGRGAARAASGPFDVPFRTARGPFRRAAAKWRTTTSSRASRRSCARWRARCRQRRLRLAAAATQRARLGQQRPGLPRRRPRPRRAPPRRPPRAPWQPPSRVPRWRPRRGPQRCRRRRRRPRRRRCWQASTQHKCALQPARGAAVRGCVRRVAPQCADARVRVRRNPRAPGARTRRRRRTATRSTRRCGCVRAERACVCCCRERQLTWRRGLCPSRKRSRATRLGTCRLARRRTPSRPPSGRRSWAPLARSRRRCARAPRAQRAARSAPAFQALLAHLAPRR